MINARYETIAEKPAFRSAFKLGATGRGRCLLVADGFYEWQRLGGNKQPFYISQKNKKPFAIAGLWESWTDPNGQLGTVESCTIVTQPASVFMQPLHDRMPVILSADAALDWLATNFDSEGLIDWLAVVNCSIDLQAWPVSTKVNKPTNDSADLVKPVEEQGSLGLLF